MTLSRKAGAPKYRIMRTTETDAYEQTPAAVKLAKLLRAQKPPLNRVRAAVKAKPPKGDNYGGSDRKLAKLSKAQGSTEKFGDLKDLVASFAAESKMIKHKPPITTASTSGRVKEEDRNVRVTAFLYAASRETDNDFHLIVGRDPALSPEMYMTMEVSGLPPMENTEFDFADLNSVRNVFKKFFGTKIPGFTYDFYDPPIPIEIEGSTFFDLTHANGARPGPQSLKSRIPTIWEIHPLTSITLG